MKNHSQSTRRSFLFASSAAATLTLLRPANLFAADKPTVTLGTATPGGGFQLFGATLSDAVNQSDAPLTIDPLATKGSGENIRLLREKKIDFGQVEGNAAHKVFEQQKDASEKLLIAAAMYPGPGMFVVRGDSPARSIADLKGKRVAFGTPSSGLTILCKTVLTGLGYDPEKDFQAIYLEKSGHGVAKVIDGEVDAWWGGGFGWPGFKKVANGPKGARFIVPDADGLKRIRSRFPYLKEMTVPKGSYAGIESDLQTLGMWSFILARPGLEDERASQFAQAIQMAGPEMAKKIEQGKYTTPQNTAAHAPEGLIHPGAQAYLKQAGVLR